MFYLNTSTLSIMGNRVTSENWLVNLEFGLIHDIQIDFASKSCFIRDKYDISD